MVYGSDVQLYLPEERHGEPLDDIIACQEGYNDDSGGVGEVVEDEDYDDKVEYNGVSTVELEGRLHELLHQRNQKRIEELELALKRAEKKHVEKEMEVSKGHCEACAVTTVCCGIDLPPLESLLKMCSLCCPHDCICCIVGFCTQGGCKVGMLHVRNSAACT